MSSKDVEQAQKQLTSVLVGIVAAVVVAVGVLLLWLAARSGTGHFNPTWSAVVSNVGGIFVATGLITFVWELVGKRSFAREVMQQAHLGTDIERAGISRITDQYLDSVEWADLIDGASKVDIVVAYANTWRNAHRHRLVKIAQRRGSRIRVFLPDPEDAQTMEVLSARFSTTPDDLASKVREAIREFSALAVAGGAELEIYVRPGDVVFSCYRFDGRAVLTLYSHTRERRTSVPTLVMKDGDLWQFVYEETNAIRQQSRRIYPA